MLSGLGVEQLKEGREASAKLFSSALAFVVGLSAVFVSMGATATAVGTFLLRNRSLLGPIAGALIVLFGLHLIGWLAKISIQVGIVVAAILVAFGDIRSLIRAATLLCVLCLPVSVLPQITNTSPESKANPVNQYKAHGYVNDFAGIIAPRFQSQLETISTQSKSNAKGRPE